MSILTPELIAQYQSLDGPSLSNAIESFDIRLRNEGFADGRIRSLFPGRPPVIGHAVTARIRCSAPPPVGLSYHDRTDWWNYIVSVPPPRVVVVPQPRPGYVWAPGYWRWDGRTHVWMDGAWMRERRGYHWVPAHWEDRHGRYHFDAGHWAR